MGSRLDDEEQIEWCRQWAEEQERKRARRRHRFRNALAWMLAAVRDPERRKAD